jgi:very-short-patch-repair endonuclease
VNPNRPKLVKGQIIDPEKLELARAMRRAMTPAEATLWRQLRQHRLAGHLFRRQQIVLGFIADFYCEQASLVVEVDGGVHIEHREEDAARDELFTSQGLRVLRVTNDEVRYRLPEVLARILAACLPPTD